MDGKSSTEVAEDGTPQYNYYETVPTTDYIEENIVTEEPIYSDQIVQDQQTYTPQTPDTEDTNNQFTEEPEN